MTVNPFERMKPTKPEDEAPKADALEGHQEEKQGTSVPDSTPDTKAEDPRPSRATSPAPRGTFSPTPNMLKVLAVEGYGLRI